MFSGIYNFTSIKAKNNMSSERILNNVNFMNDFTSFTTNLLLIATDELHITFCLEKVASLEKGLFLNQGNMSIKYH